jgi:hypothetical protein
MSQCLWFVTECEHGHVYDVGAFAKEPPEKIICHCGSLLWVNWEATELKFPGGSWIGSWPQPHREHMGDYWERKKLLEEMGWKEK